MFFAGLGLGRPGFWLRLGGKRLVRAGRGRIVRRMIYFDHNATSPLAAEARAAWLEAVERWPGNPSSPHRVGQRAEAALESAREELATMLGCEAAEIVWTSGATEGANAVFHHLARSLPGAAEVWGSGIEHPCVRGAARAWLSQRVVEMPVNREGVVELGWLRERAAQGRPGAVVCMAANNETGVLQPWQELREWCAANGVLFFCDAVQWLGRLPAVGFGRCDFVIGSAHKFGGPRGVGFLKCPTGGGMRALLVGGGQEGGRRAGTENVPGVVAMVTALRVREAAIAAGGHQEREGWRGEFERRLIAELPGSEVVGAKVGRLWNTVSALMPEADCQQRWVVKLDRFGFAVSTGSACASGKEEPSQVLTAMGCTAGEAGRVLRFSAGWETTRADWEALLEALKRTAEQLMANDAMPNDQ